MAPPARSTKPPRRGAPLTDDGIVPHAYPEDLATGCRVWLRGFSSPCHPEASFWGKNVSPVRHAGERAGGPIPSGHVLRQTCGEPLQVHPDHQEPITRPVLAGVAHDPSPGGFDGRSLRAARVAADLSQDIVAKRAGVHPSTVIQLERGRGVPRFGTLAKVSRALGVSVANLVAGDG